MIGITGTKGKTSTAYFTKAMLKISEYRKIGYTQHRNLICTYEDDLTDLNKLEEILYRFLN